MNIEARCSFCGSRSGPMASSDMTASVIVAIICKQCASWAYMATVDNSSGNIANGDLETRLRVAYQCEINRCGECQQLGPRRFGLVNTKNGRQLCASCEHHNEIRSQDGRFNRDTRRRLDAALEEIEKLKNEKTAKEKETRENIIKQAENKYRIQYEKAVVYFIDDGDNIKIGTSTNLESRIKSLSTSSSRRLLLLGVIPGGVETERKFHRRFARDRVSGEWFKKSGRLVAFINKHAQRTG